MGTTQLVNAEQSEYKQRVNTKQWEYNTAGTKSKYKTAGEQNEYKIATEQSKYNKVGEQST